MVTLKYSPATTHVTRDGAVIGTIEQERGGSGAWVYTEFAFKPACIAKPSLNELLLAVRKHEERKQ
jgi:hypothetical protein